MVGAVGHMAVYDGRSSSGRFELSRTSGVRSGGGAHRRQPPISPPQTQNEREKP